MAENQVVLESTSEKKGMLFQMGLVSCFSIFLISKEA